MRYGSDGKPEGSFKNKPAPGGNPQRRPVPVRAIPTPHEGLHRCRYVMEFGRMFNRFVTSTLGHAGECQRGAAPCRRDGQGYMPYPPLMAGRIEVAEGDRNLRGNVGRERRSRSCRIDVEGDHRMRGNDPWPPLVTLVPDGGAVGTRYFLERLARGRHTRGQPSRQARRASRSISYRIPQSVRCKAQEARGGLSVPSPHPFPKAPVLMQGRNLEPHWLSKKGQKEG